MAAPTKQTRGTPDGVPMRDGYSAKIAFSSNPTVSFWEKGVQPPGVDGGEAIAASTMHNVSWRTFGTPSLKTLTPSTVRVAYDPAVFDDILLLVNVEQEITVHFRNGGHLSFFGRLKSFEPDEMVEGTQPEATAVIESTNWDGTAEQAPVYGTGA
jgi:hypothetical protein